MNLAARTLDIGEGLCNGDYKFGMTSSGELALCKNGVTGWSAGSYDNAHKAVLQRQGQFVMYTESDVPLWDSDSAGEKNSVLSLASTGVVKITNPNGDVVFEIVPEINSGIGGIDAGDVNVGIITPPVQVEPPVQIEPPILVEPDVPVVVLPEPEVPVVDVPVVVLPEPEPEPEVPVVDVPIVDVLPPGSNINNIINVISNLGSSDGDEAETEDVDVTEADGKGGKGGKGEGGKGGGKGGKGAGKDASKDKSKKTRGLRLRGFGN
jgi:hypothetical protein